VLGYSKDASDPYAATAWLKVAPMTFTLAAGETRKLQYTMRMPKRESNADLRDVMGLVRFEGRLLNRTTRKTDVQSIGECSVVVIAGPDRAGIRECRVGQSLMRVLPEANNLIMLGLEVHNTGGVYCRLTGSLSIRGVTNSVFSWEAPLVEGQPMVFAGSSRMLWVQLPSEQFGPGEYLADVMVNYGGADAITRRVKINLMTPPDDDASKLAGGEPPSGAPNAITAVPSGQ